MPAFSPLDLPRGPKHSLRVLDLQLRDNVRGLRREAAARRPYSFGGRSSFFGVEAALSWSNSS